MTFRRCGWLLVGCLACILASCNSGRPGEKKKGLASYLYSISDNEDKGIKEIISVYGGECEYGFAKSSSGAPAERNTFWIEVRKSAAIESSRAGADLISSNIAFLFYRNLKEERDKYTGIKVKIVGTGDKVLEAVYPVPDLKLALARFGVVNEVVALLDKQDYKAFGERVDLDTSFFNVPAGEGKATFLEKVTGQERQLGAVKELLPYGFRLFESPGPGGGSVLYFAALVFRENGKKHPLSTVVSTDPSDNRIHFFNYNF
ncbi:hypothetical protein [Flaviaesturariibacter amylovorans]|uniref:Lipoprotein n=1 Tax=Flaviaesturariibacter amylovorans TaxID=1084520 RepID=A0ABP8H497_9BACT